MGGVKEKKGQGRRGEGREEGRGSGGRRGTKDG